MEAVRDWLSKNMRWHSNESALNRWNSGRVTWEEKQEGERVNKNQLNGEITWQERKSLNLIRLTKLADPHNMVLQEIKIMMANIEQYQEQQRY